MFPEDVLEQARDVLARFDAAGYKLATAESCTGGLIAGALTEIPGSSSVVDRGFVTYSNEAKTELLSVPGELIARVGAVSAEVAEAMSAGAIAPIPGGCGDFGDRHRRPRRRNAGKAGWAGLFRHHPARRRRPA